MQRKGICKNIGICNHANSHKVVIINDDNEEFVCPECGEPLEPCKDVEETTAPKKNNLPIIIGIVAAVVIVGGIIAAVCFSGGESEPTKPEPAAAVVDSDSIAAANTEAELQKERQRADSLAKVAAEAQQNTAQPQTAPASAPTAKPQQSTPKTQSSSNGKLRLSYGSYSGDLKNGYPDGMGRLTYSSSRQINRYDSKRRVANAGDYVIGEFVRGFFVQGKHYDSDGNLIETLMIGTPANDSYDSK